MKLLFVCTGNTCRSPMAEALMARAADAAGLPVTVTSAGTAAASHLPAAEHALTVMRERGADLSRHRSRPVTPEMVAEADLVLTMTRRHKNELLQLTPEAAGKIYTLPEFVGSGRIDIPDPFLGSVQDYRTTADTLDELIKALLSKIKARASGGEATDV